MSKTIKIIGLVSAVLLIVGVIFIFINPEDPMAYFVIKSICGFCLTLAGLYPVCIIAQKDSELNPVPFMILTVVLAGGAVAYSIYALSLLPTLFAKTYDTALVWVKLLIILYAVGGFFAFILANNNEYTPEFLDDIPDFIKIPLCYVFAPVVAVIVIILEIVSYVRG